MLVKKTKLKKGLVVSLKLITGEEVVGTFVEEGQDLIHLDKPYRLIQNGQNFGFAPVMITTDPSQVHSIYRSSIAIITPTYDEVRKQYDATVNSILEPDFTEVTKD